MVELEVCSLPRVPAWRQRECCCHARCRLVSEIRFGLATRRRPPPMSRGRQGAAQAQWPPSIPRMMAWTSGACTIIHIGSGLQRHRSCFTSSAGAIAQVQRSIAAQAVHIYCQQLLAASRAGIRRAARPAVFCDRGKLGMWNGFPRSCSARLFAGQPSLSMQPPSPTIGGGAEDRRWRPAPWQRISRLCMICMSRKDSRRTLDACWTRVPVHHALCVCRDHHEPNVPSWVVAPMRLLKTAAHRGRSSSSVPGARRFPRRSRRRGGERSRRRERRARGRFER